MKNEAVIELVIAALNGIDVDGETMQYIIEKTNMTEQMKSQLGIKSGKINKEDASELHTIRDANDVFGFTERYVNVLMEYAYREAMDYMQKDYIARTKEMNDAFNKIVDALDDVGMIPENCNCDC
jgi:uncharacterized protein YutD